MVHTSSDVHYFSDSIKVCLHFGWDKFLTQWWNSLASKELLNSSTTTLFQNQGMQLKKKLCSLLLLTLFHASCRDVVSIPTASL